MFPKIYSMKNCLYLIITVIFVSSLIITGCEKEQEPQLPIEGNILNLYGTDPLTLDPAISGEMTSHSYVMQIFSGLIRLDENMKPAPDIAEKWDISEDGNTYTFHLRKNVKFHNGRTVKAEDFQYSWQRACTPSTGSSTASSYLGDIIGANDVLTGKSKEISGIKVINDYTLQVTIDAPKSYFLSKLTYPTTFVVDRYNIKKGAEWWRAPNGTGPFKLRSWEDESQLVLEKYNDFHGDVSGVDFVVFSLWGGVPMYMYENGEIDITSVYIDYIDKVTDRTGDLYDELAIFPELSFYYIGFNNNSPPFDDIKVRRAFSLAIDKNKLASLVFRDMVEVADGILPPGMPGFNDELSGLDFNIEAARQLIKESSYGDVSQLPPINITTQGWGGDISQDLEAVINEWRINLGVEVTVRQLEPSRFLYHLMEEKDEMYYLGWIADYPHPQNFLDILFRTGAENNYGEYSNTELDALLDKAGKELDNELSLKMYRQAEQILVDEAACIPLFFGQNYILIKPYINGYYLNPLGITMYNQVSIDSSR